MRLDRLLVIVLIGFSGSVHAQFAPPSGGCPPGMHLEGFSCVYDRAPTTSGPPAQQWVTRWGAIAIGSGASVGGFGFSTKMKSKRKAEAAATKECKSSGGGSTCKVFAYHDQCAVVAWGTQSYTIRSAESLEIATKLSVDSCSAKTEDCQVFYSGCSFPERVQ